MACDCDFYSEKLKTVVFFGILKKLLSQYQKMFSTVKSVCWFSALCIFSSVTGIVYIDKVIQESNPAVSKVSLTYTHDAKGNSLTNVTFETLTTISKIMVYFTLRIADDKNNTGVYRDLVKTVIDVEKLFQGSQANPIVKQYFEVILRGMNFTMKFPLPPVSNLH